MKVVNVAGADAQATLRPVAPDSKDGFSMSQNDHRFGGTWTSKRSARLTGYSREHATRELSELRRETGLAFETKQRKKRGAEKASWGVIVADPEKLKFDKRSLFYDRCGNRLHNYTTLSSDGEKIRRPFFRSPGRVSAAWKTAHTTRRFRTTR